MSVFIAHLAPLVYMIKLQGYTQQIHDSGVLKMLAACGTDVLGYTLGLNSLT